MKSIEMHDIKSIITEDIRRAKNSMYIAVSWLTDKSIIRALKSKLSGNSKFKIKILISDHPDNKKVRSDLFEIVKIGASIRSWGNKDATKGGFMHCKFYIVDDKVAKSGSYNWSYNAMNNAECLDVVAVKPKQILFQKLWREASPFIVVISKD